MELMKRDFLTITDDGEYMYEPRHIARGRTGSC